MTPPPPPPPHNTALLKKTSNTIKMQDRNKSEQFTCVFQYTPQTEKVQGEVYISSTCVFHFTKYGFKVKCI